MFCIIYSSIQKFTNTMMKTIIYIITMDILIIDYSTALFEKKDYYYQNLQISIVSGLLYFILHM